MICLQCSKPAKHTDNYQSIPIGTCEDGHRTGIAPRGMFNEIEPQPFIGWEWEPKVQKAS